jgi:cytoskeletal protein CcmA (bactofilin family)
MRAVQVLLGLMCLLLLVPSHAAAAELRGADAIMIGPSEQINDDLYVFGRTITLRGTVNGDVIAFGGTLAVEGTVTGDVITFAGTTTVTGTVGGTLRAAAGNVAVDGRVGEDAVVAAGTFRLGSSAQVGRDVLLGTGSSEIGGVVGRHVLASGGDLALRSRVGGNVRADVEMLRVVEGAVIDGRLTYSSPAEAAIAQGATIRRGTERVIRAPQPGREPGPRAVAIFLSWLRTLLGLFVFGLLLVLVLPRISSGAVEALHSTPWASLGVGAGLLVGVPVLALIVFIVGLFVGGWWLGLIALALYALALVSGYVLIGLFLGTLVLDRAGRRDVHVSWALLLGLALLTLAGLIPILGGVVSILAIVLGLGALTLACVRLRRGPAVSSMA